jgi:hypothetical protein
VREEFVEFDEKRLPAPAPRRAGLEQTAERRAGV